SSGASRVTGITDEDLADEPTWAEVAPQVLAAINGRWATAYNAPADYAWLKRDCGRVGPYYPRWPWLDLLVFAKVVDKYERSKTLANVAMRRGIAVDAHGAAGDAVCAALLARPLLSACAEHIRYDADPETAWPTFRDIATWQRATALDQERDLCRYLIGQGARGSRPECSWHELEGMALPPWPEPAPPVGRCPKCGQPAVYRIDKGGSITLETPEGEPHICLEEE
ncbi:MAG: 3'-5' exonuclease, partial [Gemmatimonadota bacterium]